MPMIGQPAPQFKAPALVGGDFKDINLADYKGKWVVLYFTLWTSPSFAPLRLLSFEIICPNSKRQVQKWWESLSILFIPIAVGSKMI